MRPRAGRHRPPVAFRHDPEIELVLEAADFVICVAFAIDFLVSLWTAPDRVRYLVTWGWLDLLSAIPKARSFRAKRVASRARRVASRARRVAF